MIARTLPEDKIAEGEAPEKATWRRREWVWTELSEAPLATALDHLSMLAELTEKPLGGSDMMQLPRATSRRALSMRRMRRGCCGRRWG